MKEIDFNKVKKINGYYLPIEYVCEIFDMSYSGMKKRLENKNVNYLQSSIMIPMDVIIDWVKEKNEKK